MTRFVFITGGVVSSLARESPAAALGALLQARGFSVRLRKLDPYLNVDPGTMSPYQHGEVYVTDDGAETDLDSGTTNASPACTPTGRQRHHRPHLFRRDRQGAARRLSGRHGAGDPAHHRRDQGDDRPRTPTALDFVLVEIGGTVGDIESLPFLEAIRQLGNELGPERAMFVHLTLVPFIPSAGELKTKPTQHSVKELLNVGIQPQMLLCRCDRPIPDERAAQDRAVLQCPSAGGDRCARRRHDLCRADRAIMPRAWTARCCGISVCRRRRARSVALAADRRGGARAGGRGADRDRRQVHQPAGQL